MAKSIKLVDPGAIATGSMAPNAIYLDGAVRGTVLNPQLNSWSFDHHGEGVRFDRTCAAKQVFSALVQGLDITAIEQVVVSSVDADSVVATWIATREPQTLQVLRGDLRFQRFIDALDRVDSHGPAALLVGEAALKVSFALTANRRAGEQETTELLLAKVDAFDGLYQAGSYDETSAMPPREGLAIALDTKGGVIARTEGAVSFKDIYAHGAFGLILADGCWTVGKLPFAAVPSFKAGLFDRLNAVEDHQDGKSWGGADSIGGSPMGRPSSLTEGQVLAAIKEWLA